MGQGEEAGEFSRREGTAGEKTFRKGVQVRYSTSAPFAPSSPPQSMGRKFPHTPFQANPTHEGVVILWLARAGLSGIAPGRVRVAATAKAPCTPIPRSAARRGGRVKTLFERRLGARRQDWVRQGERLKDKRV
jgi:hypothetical protein